MTPDWATIPEPVPYADFHDPQSLNQYSYVRNIPTTRVDSDGHQCETCPLPTPTTEDVKLINDAGKRALAEEAAAAGKTLGKRLLVPAAGGAILAGEMIFPDSVDSGERPAGFDEGMFAPTRQQSEQIQETLHEPEPQPASGGNMKGSKGGSAAGKRFTPSDRKKDAGKNCVYCGQKTTEKAGKTNSRETDHIHPRSRGGNRTSKNRAPACRTCNRSKSDKTPAEWQKTKE